MSSRFQLQPDNTYTKVVCIHDIYYKLTVPKEMWKPTKVSAHAKYWIHKMKTGKDTEFKYGTVSLVDEIPDEYIYMCTSCNKKYKTRSGMLKHIHRYHKIPEETTDIVPTNERHTGVTITNNTIQNITNNIQINVPIRNFSEENPKWLTRDVIMEAIRNIPSAIPRLIQEKHFNEKFPENRNVRIINKRDIRKRLQVYDAGRWKLKDRPDIECKIIIQMYDTLNDLMEIITDDTDGDDDDDATPLERRIAQIARKIRASQFRSQRVRRMVHEWKEFADTLEGDFEKTISPLSDKLDTLLLDNEFRIKQLEERRALLES